MTATMIDELLRASAIVFGSLPPENRDLDLLLTANEHARLGSVLTEAGWVADGRTWVRFAEGSAFAVDLVVLDRWMPNATAASSIRAGALPLDGFAHLHAPAQHHRILLLAKRHRDGMELTAERRAAFEGFSSDDWARARDEADAWGLVEALDGLDAELRGGARPTERPSAAVRAVAGRLRRSRRTRLLALSGLDGAGKSTHAEHLSTALTALGYDVSVQWTKIARDPVLNAIARPIKRVIRRIGGDSPPAPVELVDAAGERRNHPDGPPPPLDAATRRREQSALLTWGWTMVVAWANAGSHRRVVRGSASAVVICDRYVLDSTAHLRYRYGPQRRFRAQAAIIRLLSPRPVGAYLLDVSPVTARTRKPEQYTTADLKRLQWLYHEEAARLGVLRVDVERAELDVAGELARAAWLSLRSAR